MCFASCLILTGGLLASPVVGQMWIHVLSEQGRISANGAELPRLKSGFKKQDELTISVVKRAEERWWDLLVDGADRYALRLDGRVNKNGELLHQLSFATIIVHAWIGIELVGDELWALRDDGLVSRAGIDVADLPDVNQGFVTLAGDGKHVYHLRSDGAVFADDELALLYDLDGGGAFDGQTPQTVWNALVVDTLGGRLLALRADGQLVGAALDGSDPLGGVPVASLPFEDPLTSAKPYVDLALRDDGRWLALRAKGVVWGSENLLAPLVDLPGGPFLKGIKQTYMRLATLGDEFFALRRDGQVFQGVDGKPLIDLSRSRYRGLALSGQAPDLTHVKNKRPNVARYRSHGIVGTPLVVPVIATDVESHPEQLLVTPHLDTVPAGAVWDAAGRRLVWDAPTGPGKQVFKVTVDDGSSKPVVVAYPIRVHPAASEDAPNRAPVPTTIRKARAQLGQPIELPIFFVDLEGDDLVIVLDEAKASPNAVFDASERVLRFTPKLEDLGRQRFAFTASDGERSRRMVLKLKVVPGLLGW